VRGPAATVSRSSTPVNGLESAAAMVHAPSATKKISVDSTAKTKTDEKVDDKQPNGNNNNNNNNNVKNGGPADAGNTIVPGQPSPSPEILVGAPSPKSKDVQADVGLLQYKGVEENSKTIVIDLSLSNFKSSAVANGLDNAKTNGQINHSSHNHVNGVVEDDEEENVNLKAQALDTEETEETDKGQYVGDGSWEEKTWKELVRLREDMFWARVGGFRG
jgi:hypothetical protein